MKDIYLLFDFEAHEQIVFETESKLIKYLEQKYKTNAMDRFIQNIKEFGVSEAWESDAHIKVESRYFGIAYSTEVI